MSLTLPKVLPVSLLVLMLCLSLPVANAAPAEMQLPADVPLRAMIGLVESQMTSTVQALRIVAATEAASSGDWDRLSPLLADVQPSASGLTWFAHPDGTYRAVGADTNGLSLKDRSYFARLLAGETVMADLVKGKVTGRSSAVVAVPVVREKQVVGAVGASIYLDELSRRLMSSLNLPPDWGIWGLDQSGKITTLHAIKERIFADPSQVGSPSLIMAVHQMLRKPSGAATYTWTDGNSREMIYRRSELLKWILVIDGPTK